ncbi:MAG TPA: DUF4160 domain-containing protein [Candidatus Binatia bacterium]
MYYREHQPPRFYARYHDSEICFSIRAGEVVSGTVPGRAQKLVLEWLDRHRRELLDDWERAQRREPLKRIDPLE